MKEYICIYDEDDMEYIPNPYLKDNELIRCKDCKYWGANGYRYGCMNEVPIMMENDYCSNAERREE